MSALGKWRERRTPDYPVDPIGRVDVDAATSAILGVAANAIGRPCQLAEQLEPVIVGAGPDAYGFRLDTDDWRWSGPLVARTSLGDVLRREVGWIRAVASTGFPTPEIVCDRHDAGVVVFRSPPGTHLAARIASDLGGIPRYLAALGHLHAQLHGVALPSPWLDAWRPRGGVPVICHGELYPTHVYLGDDNSTAAPVNWTRACLADPTYDVASTLVAFWALPLFADGAIQRRMIKMARDSLANTYLDAYREATARPLEDDGLRYWQGYHLDGLAAEVHARLAGERISPWSPAATVNAPETALAEVRARLDELT